MKHTNSFAAVSRLGWLRVASIFAILLFAGALTASAQAIGNQRIVHTVVKQHTNPPELGRDFWFSPQQNYLDEPGKYYLIYITSPNNTTAFVSCEGIIKSIPVPSYGIGKYSCPLQWEMKSSGIVENKAIHVYDPTDDICVYLMSHNPYTSDGARIIPTTGWGTDYVVAGYGALFEGFGAYGFDFPSEFTISADQDNTIVDITPSSDFRQAATYPQNATTIYYPRGQKFEIELNRGQSIQFQTTDAKDADNYDVTGTIVHSNVGIDIMAGSSCPNIPDDFPYCDQVCDQVPPVRTWAETYYTTNCVQPSGAPLDHDNSLYLMISSKPGQVIYRYDATTGLHVEATLGPTYDHIYVEEELSNKWFSDAPFLLVQYINSASFPDNQNGNGDPAECCITPAENFTQTVVFETPTSVGAQAPYDNYANLLVPVNDEHKGPDPVTGKQLHGVLFDGKSISSYAHQPIDDTFEVYLVPNIQPAAHLVQADSGYTVGVYIYGYGYDESYMWGGGFGSGTFHSPDTVPPVDVITGECFAANIHVSDSGYLPGITPLQPQTGLNEIRLDTDINMAYQPDVYPQWEEGDPGPFAPQMDTSGYSMYVVDQTKPARLVVDIFDAAGNETSITSVYTPQTAAIGPPLQNFGVVGLSDPAAILYDTITNLGQVPFKFTSLSLLYGNRGFKIDSSATLPATIPVGGKSLVKLEFYPLQLTAAVDSLVFGDPCITQEVALLGSGGAPDFYVSDVTWQNVPLIPAAGAGWVLHEAVIHNLSKIGNVTVDTAGWPDKVHFVLVSDTGIGGFAQTLPKTLGPVGSGNDTAGVWYWFEPTDLNRDITQAMWLSPQVTAGTPDTMSPRYDKLIGNAVTPSLTFGDDTTITLPCQDTSLHFIYIPFILTNSGTQDAVINSVNVTNPTDFTSLLGHDQHGKTWDPTKFPATLPPGSVDTFIVLVPINPQSNSSDTTLIIADILGQATQDTLTAIVNVQYWSYSTSVSLIPFGVDTFQNPAGKRQESFVIFNTASTSLTINSVAFVTGGAYNAAYSYSTTPPLPTTIGPGGYDSVTVWFDPSFSSDSAQQTEMQISSDACNTPSVIMQSFVAVWGAAMTNFIPTPILTCDNHVDTIQIINSQHSDEFEDAADIVDSTAWLEGGMNFSIPNIKGSVIHGGTNLAVPVTFTPNPTAGQNMQMYTDSLKIWLQRTRSGDTTITVGYSGIASSFSIAATSTFGTGNSAKSAAGGTLDMPITVTLNKNGLNGVPLAQLNITEIDLAYLVQNPNLVTPQLMNHVYGKWIATPPAWNATTGVLYDTLTGPALDEGVTTAQYGLGQIPFVVYLDATDDASNVTLTSMVLKSNGGAIGPCLGQSTTSGAMSLILQCGDSTLRLLMSGNGKLINFVNPATPDPVSGGHVTFSYANRGATNITLSILDVLGHEVLRPIDNVYHDAGAWQTTSDVTNLPSGTYTYRISAGGEAVSKQFVIQR